MGKKIEFLYMSSSPIRIKKFVNHRAGGRIHWHDEIEILYFVSGESTLLCNLREYTVKSGDIIFVNGNEVHTGSIYGSNSVYYCIHINSKFFHNSSEKEYVIFDTLIKNQECSNILDDVIKHFEDKSFKGSLYIRKRMYDFFTLLAHNYVRSIFSEDEYKKQFRRLDTFNKIVEYIDGNYCENLCVSSLSERFYMSPSYFAHFFKKKSGKSVVKYINEIRIRNAKSLLEKEDMSISDVACNVGFNDINYFSRKFKEITDVTPSEYRSRFM